MLACQRDLFGLPDDSVFLNTAYMGPQLRAASAAGVQALLAKENPPSVLGADFFHPVEEVKRLFAQIVNAPSTQDIALVPAVSYGMATVAANLKLWPGDTIVTVADVFPSIYYGFEHLAQAQQASIVQVACDIQGAERPAAWTQAVLAAIDSRCQLVAMPHVHWSDGTRFDLLAIRRRCDEVGAWLVIDGTQSVGALPFDVQAIRPDVLVVGGYKWLLGAYSFGYMYVAPHLQNGHPIEENWINRQASDDFANLTNYQAEYRPGAARFSMGEQSNFIACAMARVALQQILDWQVESISQFARSLVDANRDHLARLGWVLPQGDQLAPHLLGLRLSPKQRAAFPTALSSAGIHVSYRGMYMRVSTHVSTREQDWQRLVEVLKEASQRV